MHAHTHSRSHSKSNKNIYKTMHEIASLEMIFGLVVFEFDVKTLLNADLHLDRIVHLGVGGQGLNC